MARGRLAGSLAGRRGQRASQASGAQLPHTPAFAGWVGGSLNSILPFPYHGPVIRIRRASDDSESDFGFVTATGLVDTDGIESFCNGTQGYLTTLYDQSGCGNHLTQSDPTKQPVVYDAGLKVGTNGYLAAEFNGSFLYRTDALGLSGDPSLVILGDANANAGDTESAPCGIGSTDAFALATVHCAYVPSFLLSETPGTSYAANNWESGSYAYYIQDLAVAGWYQSAHASGGTLDQSTFAWRGTSHAWDEAPADPLGFTTNLRAWWGVYNPTDAAGAFTGLMSFLVIWNTPALGTDEQAAVDAWAGAHHA